MRMASQALSTTTVQSILRGMIEGKAPELIREGREGFLMTREWTRQLMKHFMNWSFRIPTTVASKLLADWEEQGRSMAYCVAYLVKVYSIPSALLVNSDQTGIHLVPIAGEKIWKPKGAKHV